MKILMGPDRKLKIADFGYYFHFAAWKLVVRWNRFSNRVSRHVHLLRVLIILLFTLLCGWLITDFTDISRISVEKLAGYFVSIGTMIGGITAIVFSLSIFSRQSSADLYSSQYYEVYAHDWKEQFTYLLIVCIIIVFFGLGIAFYALESISQSQTMFSIYLSLFLIGAVFVLIDWQYKNVREKTIPLNALNFLEKQSLGFLKKLHKNVQRVARIIIAKNQSLTDEIALGSAYNALSAPHLANLDRQIETLFEVSMKFSDRQEIAATNRGLSAVHNILAEYLELRKNSSSSFPSTDVFLAMESDSQKFLRNSFERLNNIGEHFIRTGRVDNAICIINIYKSLASRAKNITFINQSHENPIFDQIYGYFSFYVDFAVRAKDKEIPFQGAIALSTFALIATENGLSASLIGIQQNLLELAEYGVTNNKLFIVDECNDAWLRIIRGTFDSKFVGTQNAIKDSLTNIATVANFIHQSIQMGGLGSDFSTTMSWSKAYSEVMPILHSILNTLFKAQDEEIKTFYKDELIVFFEELNRTLRKLSENIRNSDSLLIDTIGRLLSDINELIIQLINEKEFEEYRVQLEKRLGWNIHLTSFFPHHANQFRISSGFESLYDVPAKTGISLFRQYKSDKLITDCVESLYSMVKQALEKSTERYHLGEPRLMMRLVYLGVLALKLDRNSILTNIGLKIYEFEDLYFSKYSPQIPPDVDPHSVNGLPKKEQLLEEVFKWRDDFVHRKFNRPESYDNVETRMYSMSEERDIDRFMSEIWGYLPTGSSIKKRADLEKLLNVLKQLERKKNGPRT